MEISVNGKAMQVQSALTVAELIEQMGLANKRLAVERNLEIVPKGAHAQTILNAGDRLEIVHAIGGG